MSKPTYRYEQSYQFNKKGVKHTIREQVIDGEKGLSIMFLKKVGEEFYKLYVKETEKDKFDVKEKVGEKETEKQVNEKDLLKMLKSEKLDSIIEFVTKDRGSYKNKKISLKKNYEKAAEV
jgi:hypothetical protein